MQTVLYASSVGLLSTSATRAPRWARSRAAVQPAVLAPTTTTSKSLSAIRASKRACRRCSAAIARSARLPGSGTIPSWRATSFMS